MHRHVTQPKVDGTCAECDRWRVTMLDATIVRQLAADLSPADIRRVLETFETDLCRLTAQLEAAAASGDTHAYRHAAHGLVGASAAVGAAALERMARLALGVGGADGPPRSRRPHPGRGGRDSEGPRPADAGRRGRLTGDAAAGGTAPDLPATRSTAIAVPGGSGDPHPAGRCGAGHGEGRAPCAGRAAHSPAFRCARRSSHSR